MNSHNQRLTCVLLAFVAIAIPWTMFRCRQALPVGAPLVMLESGGSRFPASVLPFNKVGVGQMPVFPPWLTNVQIFDFDDDGRADVIACDARLNRVLLYSQKTAGNWSEQVLGSDLVAPAHATVVDLDHDGDRDIVVSELGSLWPDDGVIGRVVLLENQAGEFRPRVLLDDVRRVADVQAGDLDGDGDTDLVVAVFGYARGEILWLENRGDGQFRDHELFVAAGTIHVPIADFDGDGDLDIAAVVSQDSEEVWVLENQGAGSFHPRRLFASINFDLGSAGLVLNDLDQDGDPDLILPLGDNLEDVHSYPQPYHGCVWLENRGGWHFEPHRIAHMGGTYAAAVGDLDADGDRDVVLVSMFNDWDHPGHASIAWFENDGHQNFKAWQIDERPTHLVTVACGDLNGDGQDDIVAAPLQLIAPFQPFTGVTAWIGQRREQP